MEYKDDAVKDCRKQFLEATGKVIAKNRKRKNITQEELGKVLDVSGTTIGRYEKGTIEIPASALPIASDVCEFPLREYLLEWENISVESTIRDALSGKQIKPEDDEIKYIAEHCTQAEADEILSIGMCTKMISDVEYKSDLLTVMIEHHITHKKEVEMYKRMMFYYEKLTGKQLQRRSDISDE